MAKKSPEKQREAVFQILIELNQSNYKIQIGQHQSIVPFEYIFIENLEFKRFYKIQSKVQVNDNSFVLYLFYLELR